MIILILFLILGSVMALTIYFKENKEMKIVHQQEMLYLEKRIAAENIKLKVGLQSGHAENQIQLKLSILKKQADLLTFIANQNEQ